MNKKMQMYRKGFTLVEVLVASTIGAFISMVAVGTLQSVIFSNKALDINIASSSEVKFASSLIKRDLINFYRDENIENTKFIGTYGYTSELDYETSDIVFYTLNRSKARPSEPEGDLYEVEYFMTQDELGTKLMRRMWPYPDEEDTEPGGVLTVIAENISYFEVTYFDGEEWIYEWTEENEALPDMVQVSIVGETPEKGLPITDVFIHNFVCMASTVSGSETTE